MTQDERREKIIALRRQAGVFKTVGMTLLNKKTTLLMLADEIKVEYENFDRARALAEMLTPEEEALAREAMQRFGVSRDIAKMMARGES